MFKYAYMYRKRKIGATILLVLQLAFLIFNVYNISLLGIKIKSESVQIESFFKDKVIYAIEPSGLDGTLNNVFENSSTLINDYIDSKKDKNFNFTLTLTTNSSINRFDGDSDFRIVGSPEGQDYVIVNQLIVNEEALEVFPYKILKGRNFDSEDFVVKEESEKIPVILGYNYAKYFDLGDKIIVDNREAQVIGFLQKNQITPGHLMLSTGKFANLNDYIITPSGYRGGEFFTGAALLVFDKDIDKSYINEIANDIRQIFEEIDFKADVRDFGEELYHDIEWYFRDLKDTLISTIIIAIFTFVTFTLVILNSILTRLKEFSVHCLVGGTKYDIVKYIVWELVILNSLALGIGLIFSLIVYKEVDIFAILLTIITMFAINATILILPYIKINKINISSVIKGED